MKQDYNIQRMQEFSLKNIPDLDTCVLAALELFTQKKNKKISFTYKHPLIVGSGNAAATGEILFEGEDVLFGDESTFLNQLKNIKSIDGIVLISASGGKHAPIIARAAKKYNKKVTLITNNKNALAIKQLNIKEDNYYVFPKNREPYTYNTSTYLGPILSHTQEDPEKIYKFIKKSIDTLKLPNLKKYKRYYLIVPEEFEGIIRLLNVKFIELFGRNIARDIETYEYVKHATTVVPAKDELFITFGRKYKEFGKEHFYIPLPKDADYGAMMAIGYYLIGKIQKAHPPWFKKNIESYTKKVSKIFNQEIKPIVE